MAVDIVASLRTTLEDAVAELQEYQALYNEHGDSPNFQINGVAVDWPAFEMHLIDKVKGLQDAIKQAIEMELAADQYAEGPVILVTRGK